MALRPALIVRRRGQGRGRLNSLGKACTIRKKRYAEGVTKLLQTAIEKLSKLPEKEQDVYAHVIMGYFRE